MYDGYYQINLELNQALVNLPHIKSSDRRSRGLNITRTLNGVVQSTPNQAIYLNAVTPDSRHIFAMANVIDTDVGNYVLTYPDSMGRVAGNVSIEITIIDPTGQISSSTGIVVVEEALSDYSMIEDSSDYPGLLQALNIIQQMEARLTVMEGRLDNAELFQTGTIVMSPVALNSDLWVALSGQSTADYPTLSPIFGATFPNMNGRTGVQIDTTQTEFNTLFKTGGKKTHILTVAEMPQHIHNLMMYSTLEENAGNYGFTYYGGQAFQNRVMVKGNDTQYSSLFIAPKGDGGAHNNLQPYTVLGKFYVHV